MTSARRKAACKACQLLKIRCEFDDHNLSTSCERCTRKKIECVMPIPAPKRCKVSHSADMTNSSRQSVKQPVQSPKPQNGPSLGSPPVANSDARDKAQYRRDGAQQSSPAASSEQPQSNTSEQQARASPQDTPTPSTNPNCTPHSSNDPPPGMMLFPISRIQAVLDIYDRRKQRIQYLEAQVDDLEHRLNNPTKVADQAGSKLPNNNGALDQQRSLVAALGGALVHQAKIIDLNALYNLLDDLGVDQSHYWALYDNEEFRKSFPVSCEHQRSKSTSKSAQVEKPTVSPFQKALEVANHTPSPSTSASAKTPPTQPKESASIWPNKGFQRKNPDSCRLRHEGYRFEGLDESGCLVESIGGATQAIQHRIDEVGAIQMESPNQQRVASQSLQDSPMGDVN